MSSVIAFREILTVISEDRSVAQRETACPTSHSQLSRWFKEKSPFRLASGLSGGSGDPFTASTWGGNVSKKDVFLAFLSSLLGPWTRPKGMRGTPMLLRIQKRRELRGVWVASWVAWPHAAEDLPILISSSVRVSPMKSNWNDCSVWENFWTAEE